MKTRRRAAIAAFAAIWVLLGAAYAQQEETQTAAEDVFPPDQVEQLVAPIALYPDALLAQVLMASTYPLDIVQAARWQKDNPDLAEEALDSAIAEEPWDQSVKSLLFFPDVLAYMNDNLDWTQDLGDAVLAQQDDVTDAVQVLRREAQAAGNLETTEQQKVEVAPAEEGVEAQAGAETIIIQPADPQVVYVPSYDPSKVYGQTEPPATTYYPEAYTTPTTGYVSDSGDSGSDSLVNFGVGALAGGLLTAAIMWDDDDDYDRLYWGGPGYYGGSGYWNSPNYWSGGYRRPGEINIDRNLNIERGDIDISRDRGDININREVKKWEHNPERRGGVRYRDKETRNKFAEARREGIDRDTARGRDPDRKRPELGGKDRPQPGGKDRPQLGDRDRPGQGGQKRPDKADLKRPATREAARPQTRDVKRPEARPARAPAKKDIKRPETRQAKAPQKRDVKLKKPQTQAKRPVAKPAAKPAARPAKASRPAKSAGGKSSAFKAQKGQQARAAKNRGAKSRGGGRKGGGGRGGRRG
jgi:hypothetical protein